MELWSEVITDKSWQVLQELKKSTDFILIGGWAIYLLTRSMKSKDIDIVVDFDGLSELKKIGLRKNEKLKKYEMEIEGVDIDIYLYHYSKIAIPPQEVAKEIIFAEGFKIPRPEVLLILKQQAEMARGHSVKGQKDRIDMISLMMKTPIDPSRYMRLLKKFGITDYSKHLRKIISTSSKEFEYVGIKNPREIKKIKKNLLNSMKF